MFQLDKPILPKTLTAPCYKDDTNISINPICTKGVYNKLQRGGKGYLRHFIYCYNSYKEYLNLAVLVKTIHETTKLQYRHVYGANHC